MVEAATFLPVIIVVALLIFCRDMLSKMMKDQQSITRTKRNTEESAANNKKSFSTSSESRNIEKRMKPNLKPSNGPAHGTPTTNWEKFKDLIKDSGSDEKKIRTNNAHTKTFPRQRRNYSHVECTASTPASTFSPTAKSKVNIAKNKTMNQLTKQVAIDCEMVGIGNGTENMLARVSLVNRYGVCVYDKYVKPREKVQDYRTPVSGIRPDDLYNGENFETVQREVAEILQGRLLIGHALKHDTDVLFLSHPKRMIRDTSRYKQFRKVSMGNTPSLKRLAAELLGIDIQSGEHSSVEDARTAMQLYMLYKNQWETDIRTKR
ncbi:RNA exonuclease 4 isoform X1 [Neodiprion virginianus]|uniref:RNA exonuclease 4 isoform X1 n=1 Tax=Neodiprion virginianus TaxID=2961670 RepID=UPI001EE70C61|nr:RNA exonuclease 4 isoform X1 [Neodiprion virginianus]